MKVCLINLPDAQSLDPKLDAPLGLMYISAYLKKNGTQCEISDWSIDNTMRWADIYGITINSPSFNRAIKLAQLLKKWNPKCKTVAGGPHPTADPWRTWTTGVFDYVVMGEGEQVMVDIANGTAPTGILKGIELDIDHYPFPDRKAVPIDDYTRKVAGIQSCSMITSRGCPYKCVFCSSHLMWDKVRFRSAESVIEEIRQIYNHGFRAIHFWDDTFTLKPSRLDKVLDAIRDLGLIFRCNGNLRKDTPWLLKRLYKAGCREYCVGVESGSQKILDIIGKGTTVKRNLKTIKAAKATGLTVKAYLMVGSPGEDWSTISQTAMFMKKAQPDQWTLFNFIPMPGCDVYENPEKYKIKLDDVAWEERFCIGGNNVGGLTHETEMMSKEEIEQARQFLLSYLPKQKGKLQDYQKMI